MTQSIMQRSAAGSYVCWRCLSRGLHPRPSLVRRPCAVTGSRSLRDRALGAPGASSASLRVRTFATVQEARLQPQLGGDTPRIRRRLREWHAEKEAGAPPTAVDNGESGSTRNLLTRPRNLDEIALEGGEHNAPLEHPFSDRDGSIDFHPPPSDVRPGDLIEYLADGERLSLMAICLGHINGFYHFYLNTGKWAPLQSMSTRFVVRNFVGEKEVQPLVDKLPKEILPIETLWAMSKMKMGPDRACGAELLRKMDRFQQGAERAMQEYATRFEKAHELVAQGGERCVTLNQICARLIGDAEGENFMTTMPPHKLYAVHRTIMSDDVGFRPLGTLSDSQTWLFEVTPQEDVALVQNMQTLVRLFTDIPAKVKTPLSSLTSSQLKQSQLGRFVLKARAAIDQSRRFRDWTPHGMLGPSKQGQPRHSTQWNDIDMSILHFMLLWAGYDQFSLSSRFHWIGSAVLRATGRYNDSEYLSTTVGWTFLQEVGYLTPWEIHDRYNQRLPDVKVSRQGGFAPLPLGPEGIRPYLTRDVFDGKRHDWSDLKAFAVDSKDTTDIDDAVSIEATDVPSEHWVHIHVADPASRIRHQCALGERASLTPLTLYLSGHYSNIWGVRDQVQKLFSLAPNKPCLTFSGRVNDEGELLDYKITPAKLQEFIYMTPGDANAAAECENTDSTTENFIVGKPPAEQPAGREMTGPSELQPEDLESLKTLYQVAKNIHERRLAHGAMPRFTARPIVKAFFDSTSIEHSPPGLMTCGGDPSIRISMDTSISPMVTSIMQLAGEIAAKWCADRNVPIPYLTQPLVEKNLGLIKSYTEKVYYPVLLRGEVPDQDMFSHLQTLLGPNELSTRPGRHFIMGVDGYAKVTSPLRRYSDLLAHWQIESALAQEMELGKVAEQRLPFSRRELEKNIFPWLRLRQRLIRRLDGWAGTRGYILQAMVRAWKFPEEDAGATGRLPERFRFTVHVSFGTTDGGARRKVLAGRLDWFDVGAWMMPEGLGRLGLSLADIRKGDVFEVKLVDVNVHSGEVTVEATEKVKVQRDQEGAGAQEGAGGEETEKLA